LSPLKILAPHIFIIISTLLLNKFLYVPKFSKGMFSKGMTESR
jgi:hypothetical protein